MVDSVSDSVPSCWLPTVQIVDVTQGGATLPHPLMAGVVVLALVVLTLVVLTLVVLALVVQVLVVLVLVVLVPLLLSLHASTIAGLGEAKFIIGNDDIRLVASRSTNIGC